MESLDLGEALLDALILRVAPPPCSNAELLSPLFDIAPTRGERFGPRIVAVVLLDLAGHGDTEPQGGHLEASLALGTEQNVQLTLCLWEPSSRSVVLKSRVTTATAFSMIWASPLAHLEMFDLAVPTVFPLN